MEWDYFHTIEKTVIDNLIKEIQNLELPSDWNPKEVLGFITRKLEDKKRNV
jgi:hypothetical protein